MGRQEEQAVLRLWFDWCKLWPEQYAHDSLMVKPEGYDPIFDVIPSQAYKDFYYEVIRGHPSLKALNPFEVVDITLNQIPAPEVPIVVPEPTDRHEEPSADVTELAVLEESEPHAPGKSGKHRKRKKRKGKRRGVEH